MEIETNWGGVVGQAIKFQNKGHTKYMDQTLN